jgi:hypothetical protein
MVQANMLDYTQSTRPIPDVCKNIMGKILCYQHYHQGNGIVMHPIPLEDISKDLIMVRAWDNKSGKGMSIKPSIGAIDYNRERPRSKGQFLRFATPWSPGGTVGKTFRPYLDKLQSKLNAKDGRRVGNMEYPWDEQWYRYKDEHGDRLWFETNDTSKMIKAVEEYMKILQEL